MSVAAIDTIVQRTTERLTFFMTKHIEKEPLDQIFTEYPVLDHFWKTKEVGTFGRQVRFDNDTALGPNFRWFQSGDTFTTTIPNSVRPAVYAMVNAGDTVNIDWEELMEASTDDVRAYDITKQRKANSLNTIRDNISRAMLATGNGADRIVGLPNLIDAISTVAGIDRTTNAWWQAQVTAAIGGFPANGLTSMRGGYNLCVQTGQGTPTIGLTTRAVHELFEAETDPDVRYADPETQRRGALQLFWKGFPLHFDQDMTAGEMYFLNNKWVKFLVDERANMTFDAFREPVNQKQATGKFLLRLALIVKQPRANWKGTGITA